MTASYTIKQPGYAFMYISNEQPYQTDVFFDDVTVAMTPGSVMQVQDYYPFGLTFNSYSRENTLINKSKLFQGQEHVDDLGLNWDSFKWRNYMPDVGRFFNVDPLAEKYVHNSTYAFAENKVITFVELEGLEGLHYTEKLDNGQTGHVIEKNVVVLTRQTSSNYSAKKNARIERENSAKVTAVKTELSDHYSGAKNEANEPVRFQFNVEGVQVANTKTGGTSGEVASMSKSLGLKGDGGEVAPAAILSSASTLQSQTTGSLMTVDPNKEGAISHEVGHTMMLGGQSKGGKRSWKWWCYGRATRSCVTGGNYENDKGRGSKNKLIMRSAITLCLFFFYSLESMAQEVNDKYVIVTVVRKQNNKLHPKEFDYWIVRPKLWDKAPEQAISPLYLAGFSVQDFNECRSAKTLMLFSLKTDENFTFPSEYIDGQKALLSLILDRVKILSVKKRWSSSKKERTNIYLTPVSGKFCFCEIMHKEGTTGLGFEGMIAMPVGNFNRDFEFFKSDLASQVKQFDYSSLPFLGLQKIQY